MLTDDDIDNILGPIFAEMEPINDAQLFLFWMKASIANTAFIRGLPDDSARQLDPILEQFGNISLKRQRPALTHEGNIICLRVSHLFRLLYDRVLTFEAVWFLLSEFVTLVCGNLEPVLLRRVLPTLIYQTPVAAPDIPATPAKEVRRPPPLPKHLPPDIVYGDLLGDLDREESRARQKGNRTRARQRNRARRAGIEPPAYVNAVALPNSDKVPEQSNPPPYA